MPEIPILGTPQMRLTRTANAPYVGTAGYQSLPNGTTANLNQTALAFQGIGAITDAAEKIAGHFADKFQTAKDEDAYSKAMLNANEQFTKFHEDIQNRTDYGNFQKDYGEVAKNVNEGVQPYLDGISETARRRIENDLAQMTSTQGLKTRSVRIQREVSDMKQSAIGQINSYVDTGNINLAKKRLGEAVKAGLFHQSEIEGVDRLIVSRDEYNTVKRNIDGVVSPYNSIQMKGKLFETDDKGNYVNFKNLTSDARYSFGNELARKTDRLESQMKDDVVAQFIAGSRVPDEKINAMPLDQGLKNELLSMGKRMDENIRKGQIEAETDESKKIHDGNYLGITAMPWPKDDSERLNLYNKLGSEILTSKKINDKQKQSLYSHLKTVYEEANKPGSYTHSKVYQVINKKMEDDRKAGELFSLRPGTIFGDLWMSKNTGPSTQNYVNLAQSWDQYFKDHPDTTIEQAEKWYDANKKYVNEHRVINGLRDTFTPVKADPGLSLANSLHMDNAPGEERLPSNSSSGGDSSTRRPRSNYITEVKTYVPPDLESGKPTLKAGQVVNGWKFKGGDPKKQVNWEKQ